MPCEKGVFVLLVTDRLQAERRLLWIALRQPLGGEKPLRLSVAFVSVRADRAPHCLGQCAVFGIPNLEWGRLVTMRGSKESEFASVPLCACQRG